MANVLSFIYHKDIMKARSFVLSHRDNDDELLLGNAGAVILNNVLAFLAGIEVDYPSLRSVALANLQEATRAIKNFFSSLENSRKEGEEDPSSMQTLVVDEAEQQQQQQEGETIPSSESEPGSDSSSRLAPHHHHFLTETELEMILDQGHLYKPLAIALQAIHDLWLWHYFPQSSPSSKFFTQAMMPLREEIFGFVHAIFPRLVALSNKFRTEELPRWEEMGLVDLLLVEEEFFLGSVDEQRQRGRERERGRPGPGPGPVEAAEGTEPEPEAETETETETKAEGQEVEFRFRRFFCF